MSSLATVNTNTLNGVKYGSTEVKKIMRGSDRLWPKWPIVLYENGYYYTINGIVNNEYDMDLINTKHQVVCVLGDIRTNYRTGLYRTNDLTLEMCFTLVESNGRTFFGNTRNDTGYSARWFNSGTTLYLDYRATNGNYSTSSRTSYGATSNTNWRANQTSLKFLYRAGFDSSNGHKFIKLKTIESDKWNVVNYDFNIISYSAPESQNSSDELIIGNRNSSYDRLKMYYMALFNSEEKCLGFWYFRWDGSKYSMYDEITQSYLPYYDSSNTTNNTYYSDNNVTYEIENYNGPIPFIIDGTITDSSGTYERLYCAKSGIELKGRKLS